MLSKVAPTMMITPKLSLEPVGNADASGLWQAITNLTAKERPSMRISETLCITASAFFFSEPSKAKISAIYSSHTSVT